MFTNVVTLSSSQTFTCALLLTFQTSFTIHYNRDQNYSHTGNSLETQWLELHISTAEGSGNIPHATLHGQKNHHKTQKNYS